MGDRNSKSIFNDVDWVIVLLYLVLITMGWLNIYSAVYNEEHYVITDMTQKYGKQLLWIGTSIFIAIIILVIDEKFYTAFAYLIYGLFMLAIIVFILCLIIQLLHKQQGIFLFNKYIKQNK